MLASGAWSRPSYEIISRSAGQLWVKERLWFDLQKFQVLKGGKLPAAQHRADYLLNFHITRLFQFRLFIKQPTERPSLSQLRTHQRPIILPTPQGQATSRNVLLIILCLLVFVCVLIYPRIHMNTHMHISPKMDNPALWGGDKSAQFY